MLNDIYLRMDLILLQNKKEALFLKNSSESVEN